MAYKPMPRLILRCGDSFEFYVLSEEGKTRTKQFTSMVAALTYAESLYKQQVDLTILNEVGTFIMHSKVNPNSN